MHDLIVTHEFGTHFVGQKITDPAKVKAILKGPNKVSVVKVVKLEALDEPHEDEDERPEHEAEDH